MKHSRKGFIAILTVLVLLVFSLSLTIAVTYLSIDGSQSAFALAQGEVALQVAEGCAEDALLLSRRDENYAGGKYSYFGADCIVAVDKNDIRWTLNISSTKNKFTRSLEITFDRIPDSPATLTLKSWLEQ